MSLQTWEDEEILYKIRRLDEHVHKVERELAELRALSKEILDVLKPTYTAPADFSFRPAPAKSSAS
jgi:hypothetical protein